MEPTPEVVVQLKPLPLTCRLKPSPPTMAPLGTREVIVGAALSTVNRRKSEVLAPSTMVIWCTPTVSRVAGMTAVKWFASTKFDGCHPGHPADSGRAPDH